MKAWNLLKEIWSGCTLKEVIGWLFFAGGISALFITQTVLWDITYDKLDNSYLVYRFIVSVFLTTFSGMGLFMGYRAINIGWHLSQEDEFWRAFTGGLFFTFMQVFTVLVEGVFPSLRESQLLEYIQGFFYMGTATGCGMVWYLYMVGYVRKKHRDNDELNEPEENEETI